MQRIFHHSAITALSAIAMFGLSAPRAASAAVTSTSLQSLISAVHGLVNSVIPVVLSLGLLVFLWGLVVFIAKAGDKEARDDGRHLMVWGIITLFVMLSVWGIVGLLNQTLDIPAGGPPPQVPLL